MSTTQINEKSFRINRNQVSFHYNGTQIQANDSKITPYWLDIGNAVDAIVDVTFEEGSLAELDCAICISSASERCYCFPCNHIFCINCSLNWFLGLSNSDSKLCPLCRSDVDQLHLG